MELYDIIFCILMLVQIPANYSWFKNRSIKNRIFWIVVTLCLTCAELALGLYTGQNLMNNIMCILLIILLAWALHKNLNLLEQSAIIKDSNLPRKPSKNNTVIDVENFTNCN